MSFSRCRPPPSWLLKFNFFNNQDFQKIKILMVGTLWGAKMRHRAKFNQNQSNGCEDIAISNFQNGGRPPCMIC